MTNVTREVSADSILVSQAAAARALGTTVWQVTQLLNSGVIQPVYQGARRMVLASSLRAYARSLTEAGK